jgi:hypothetical protein
MCQPLDFDRKFHLNLTGFFHMRSDGRREDFLFPLLKSFPWITELAYNSDDKQNKQFRDAMAKHTEKLPDVLLFKKSGDEFGLVKEVIDHFKTRKVSDYLESEWDDNVIESMWSTGVARAMVFKSKDDNELRIMAQMMIELQTVKTLREWEIKIQATPTKKGNVSTAISGCNLFWSIMYYYKILCSDFDENAKVQHWGGNWFNQKFAAMKATTYMKAPRALLSKYVSECQAIMSVRKEIVDKHDTLMPILRAAVISAPTADEIGFIREMIREMQRSKELQLLLRGIPMPPFDTGIPLLLVENLEQEQSLMDFIDYDTVEIQEAPPVAVLSPEAPSGIEEVLGCVCSELHNTGESPSPPHLILEQVTALKSEVIAIQQLASECAAEIHNLVLEEIRHAIKAVKQFPEVILQLAVEFQTIQYDQQRRMVRREVKRIRETRNQIVTKMLPFSAEQHQLEAVQAMRTRALSVAKDIKDLASEADRINDLAHRYSAEEAVLLDQHTRKERKRVFLEVAPHFLPVTMYEQEIDCGLCLGVLGWKHDKGIRLVTCCPEFGFVCGACMLTAHPHPIESEIGVVRIVKSVREALGFQ